MSLLYLAGKDANILRRATVECDPAAPSVAPLTNLYDDDPSSPHLFGSAAANCSVYVSPNVLTNPTFDSGITGWTTVGTVAHTTTAGEWRTASGGMKITNGYAYQAIVVPAGESRKFSAWARVISGTPRADVRIQNATTGNWWNGTAWQSTQTYCASTTSSSFAELTTTYTVESFDVVGADHCTLLILLYAADASLVAVFDDAYDVPGVSFMSIHGHNITPRVVTNLYSDSVRTFVSAALVATLTVKRGAFFATFAMTYPQFWRLTFVGTPFDPIFLGEMVLGQHKTCATVPEWGISNTKSLPGVRSPNEFGRVSVYNVAEDPAESISMDFLAATRAAASEIENIWLRSGQGRHPTVIVPRSDELYVYLGRLLKPFESSRPVNEARNIHLDLIGDPFPLMGE